MENISVLDFLAFVHRLYATDYANEFRFEVNLLSKLISNNNFDSDINIGTVFVRNSGLTHEFYVVDGLRRIISVSLILFYMFDSNKYILSDKKLKDKLFSEHLFYKSKPKIILNDSDNDLYMKILEGQHLTDEEKESDLGLAANQFKNLINENHYVIFKLYEQLKNVKILLINTDKEQELETFYQTNKNNRKLNLLKMINNYLRSVNAADFLKNTLAVFDNDEDDLLKFLKVFLVTKTTNYVFEKNEPYEYFRRYVETMNKYKPMEKIFMDLEKFAKLYKDIINLNFSDACIKNLFISIKTSNANDALPFLLELYGDYVDHNITESVFIDLLEAINQFIQDRNNSPESQRYDLMNLSQELNQFICSKMKSENLYEKEQTPSIN